MVWQFGRLLAVSTLLFLNWTESADAFGSRNKDPNPPSSAGVQAIPIRHLELAHITPPAFFLPNGSRVDMNTDLKTIIDSQINQSRYFRTALADPQNRLVITGGITSLELDILELGLKVGWNPAGAIPIGNLGITGEVNLKLSNLSMDFKIYDRVTRETYLASYTNETLSNLKFQVKVEISQIGGSLELLTKTKLADAIRQATSDIMKKLEGSPGLHFVPWEARVLGVAEGGGELSFSAGGRSGIQPNFVFAIYSNCEQNSSSMCFERFLADVKVTTVGQTSSQAVAFTASDSLNGVMAGDKVYVKPLNSRR